MAAAEQQRPQAVLVACGSFNPPTIMHLRMFDLAAHHLRQVGWDVVGQYMSPVGDAYTKEGLCPAVHRLRMCQLAAQVSGTVEVQGWEAAQPWFTPTLDVLRHVQHVYTEGLEKARCQAAADSAAAAEAKRAAAALAAAAAPPLLLPPPQPPLPPAEEQPGSSSSYQTEEDNNRHAPHHLLVAPSSSASAGQGAWRKKGLGGGVRVMLLCGSDLLASLNVPGLWSAPELMLQQHGAVCIARIGTDVEQLLDGGAAGAPATVLGDNAQHIMLVKDPVSNMISSSAVRSQLAQGGPVRYLVPDTVLQYIRDNDLYTEH